MTIWRIQNDEEESVISGSKPESTSRGDFEDRAAGLVLILKTVMSRTGDLSTHTHTHTIQYIEYAPPETLRNCGE